MDVSDRNLQLQLTRQAKLLQIILHSEDFAFAGFVSRLKGRIRTMRPFFTKNGATEENGSARRQESGNEKRGAAVIGIILRICSKCAYEL